MVTQATSFKFDATTSELLESLKISSNSSSKAEVLRKALTLLAVLIEEKNKNGKISIKVGDKEKEIII